MRFTTLAVSTRWLCERSSQTQHSKRNFLLLYEPTCACTIHAIACNVLRFTASKQYSSFDILLVKQRCLKRKQVLVKKLRIVKNERNRSEPTEIMLMWPNTPATWTWYVASVAHKRNMPNISVYKIHQHIFVPYKKYIFSFLCCRIATNVRGKEVALHSYFCVHTEKVEIENYVLTQSISTSLSYVYFIFLQLLCCITHVQHNYPFKSSS